MTSRSRTPTSEDAPAPPPPQVGADTGGLPGGGFGGTGEGRLPSEEPRGGSAVGAELSREEVPSSARGVRRAAPQTHSVPRAAVVGLDQRGLLEALSK